MGYKKKNQIMKIKSLYELIETTYPPEEKLAYFSPHLLNTLLESFIRLQMQEPVIQILKYFVAKKRKPKGFLLRQLSRMDYLCDEIFVLLDNFEDNRIRPESQKERKATGNQESEATKLIYDTLDKFADRKTRKNKIFV
jgi:hypothetical protein